MPRAYTRAVAEYMAARIIEVCDRLPELEDARELLAPIGEPAAASN